MKQEAHYAYITREASTTLIFIHDRLAAYYTLLRTPIQFETETDGDWALHIARIAVDVNFQGKGLGTFLIKHIIDIAYQVNERFITTDALYEKWRWYENLQFTHLIEKEIENNETGLVYMGLDLLDEDLINDYLEQ